MKLRVGAHKANALVFPRAGVQLGRLPEEAQLPSIANLETQQSQGELLAKLAANLMGEAEGTSGQSSSVVSLGLGMPALPKKLVERIKAGDYVDFTEMPPAKGKSRPLSSVLEGQVVLVQVSDLSLTRKVLPDLATWTQCFVMYVSVISTHQPQRVPDLMAYMSLIIKASQKYRYPSWIVYDQNFRQQAAEVGSTEWARVDPSIYTQCFTGMALNTEGWCKFCQSIDHASENCPSRQHWQRKRGVPAASPQSMPQTKRVVSANAVCRGTTVMMETATSAKLAVSSTCAVSAKALTPSPSVVRVGNRKSRNKQGNGTEQPTSLILQYLKFLAIGT